MAYTDEANAGFRITEFKHGSTAVAGMVRAVIEKIINREVIKADANNAPVARPIDEIDARVTAEFLDASAGFSETAAAASIVATFSQADGSSSGSVTVGPMRAGSITHTMARNQGGHATQQVFEMEGSTLTYSVTV